MSRNPEIVTPAFLREHPLPELEGSKHARGDVIVVGGARRTPGAAMLTGLAALRVGAGRLTLAVGNSVAVPVAVAVPEAGVVGLAETDGGAVSGSGASALEKDLDGAGCLVVGPGLDDPEEAGILLEALAGLLGDDVPVLLDAYALGVLPDSPAAQKAFAGRLLLTPNSTEAGFLLGRDPGDLESDAAEIAERFGAVVSCMNVIADPSGVIRQVPTGHAGLATSGSGDVLAGAIAGLAARGAELPLAAAWGTYLHAASGDRLSVRIGATGFLARELLDELPALLTELR